MIRDHGVGVQIYMLTIWLRSDIIPNLLQLRSKEVLNFTLKGEVLTFTADEGDYQVNLQKV